MGKLFKFAAALSMLFVLSASGYAVSAKTAPYTRIDPATSQEITPDANAIWMENEHLKIAVMTTAPHSGQVFSLVYKPTGQELCNPATLQGYWQDRGIPGQVTEGKGEIISQSDDQAQIKVTYLNSGEADGKKIAIRHTKTYTLLKGASYILVSWKHENISSDSVMYSPWVKHVGGMGEKFLNYAPKIVVPQGLVKLDWDIPPTFNWVARLSGEENTEGMPMVTSFVDYSKIFRQCAWFRPPRYTLETTLNRLDFKPGESAEVATALSVTPNLGQISYAVPELSASLTVDGELKPGKESTLKVNIASGLDLGEKRLEGQISNATGETVANIPNQQVMLKAGKISTVSYSFVPPGEGVYFINLTVFEKQLPVKLGECIKSQKSSISLPIVVGTAPSIVFQNWKADGNAGFPRRKEREVKPCRTLFNSSTLKVGQISVPERIFPEDKMIFGKENEPASIRMAGGEFECLQFAVDIPENTDPMDLMVSVSTIMNEKGVALETVELREQIYLTTEIPSNYMDFPIGQWPDPLFETDWAARIPNAPITSQNIEAIKKSHKRVYWLTIGAQSGAPGGIYKGAVSLSLKDKPAGEFPVEIRVNSFSLPKRAALRCSTGMVGWKGLVKNMTIMGLPQEEISKLQKDAMDQYRRLILKYGWTPTMYFSLKEWEKYYDYGRGISVFSVGERKKKEETESKEVRWLKEKNLLKYAFTYAPFDEHTDSKVPEVVEWAKKWKAESEIPILDCYYGSNIEPLFGLVDIWLGQDPRSKWWGTPVPPLGWGEKAIDRKKAGDQFFSCNATLIWHVEFIPSQGRAEFWGDFVSGVDGRYVYSTCRWTDDVYKKNWTTGNYMGCAVYPGPYGVTTSIRLETLRDGVEDYDYLALLRSAVENAKKKNISSPVIKDAEAIVNDPKIAEKVKTPNAVNAMRDKIADLIGKLQ